MSKASEGVVLPGPRPAERKEIKWNEAGLGRRRPKLKKCRVSNTQIGFHPESLERSNKQKNTERSEAASLSRMETRRMVITPAN